MSIATSITKYIQRQLLRPTSPTPTTTTHTPIPVDTIVAVDRHMPIISVMIGTNKLDDVLLDGGSGVNVITEQERCRLGLPTPTAAPYKLRMADGTLVQPVGLLRNIKIHIHGIAYTIILTVISCQDVKSAYTLLLGRPWLRDARVIHDWSNDQIQIMGDGTIRTIPVNRELGLEATTPETLVCYNYVEGLSDNEESILLAAEEFLHPIGTIAISDFYQVSTLDNPDQLIRHTPDIMPVDEIPIHEKVKTIPVAHWSQTDDEQLTDHNLGTDDEQLTDLNLGTDSDPQVVRIGIDLSPEMRTKAKELFTSFKDVFAWSYHDLRGIPESICQHKIELDISISPSH